MVYNSIYDIPSRLFFQIMETGQVSLLDTDFKGENLIELEDIWINLEEADQKLSKNPKTEKFLDVSKLMESLKCQQKKVELAILYLKVEDDDELKTMLMNEGYSFSGDMDKDLGRIERMNRDLIAQIEKLELQLPKQKQGGKTVPFDELVIGYGMIAGQAFRTNEITQSEFRALENNVKLKLETLPKPKNGRKR